MSNDARILTSLPAHPKTRKLIKILGQSAGWNLICLFLFARDNKPDGILSGMNEDDIEIASDWLGTDGLFVDTLVDCGFLDVNQYSEYSIHDWGKHNPWSLGTEKRSIKARWNAIKRHHGEAEADRQVPEYNEIYNKQPITPDADSNANSITVAMRLASVSNAPSPSPLPSPKSKTTLALTRFADFWAVYPRRDDKAKAEKSWLRQNLDKIADEVIDGANAYARSKIGTERQFIALPTTWLNGKRWQDEKPNAKTEPVRPLPTKPLPETPEQAAKRKADEQAAWRQQMERMGVAV